MTLLQPIYLGPVGSDAVGPPVAAQTFRALVAALLGEGIVNAPGGDFAVSATSGMVVSVASGAASVTGDDVAQQGAFFQLNVGAVSVTAQAAPSSNSRIDVLVLRIYDGQTSGGTNNRAALEWVTGTAAASPTAPTVPATAIALAQVLLTAGTTTITAGMITDVRTPTTAGTAVTTQFQKMTTAQRNALPSPAVGTSIYNTTTARNETYLGATLGWFAGNVDVQTFTTSGTWTKPANAQLVIPIVFGGGGSGAGGSQNSSAINYRGGGGGGGACATAILPASTLPTTSSVTVGAGGTAVAAGTAGNAGGASQFASLLAGGGFGGAYGSYALGGWGGSVGALIANSVSGNPTSCGGGQSGAQSTSGSGPGARSEYGGGGGGQGSSTGTGTTGYSSQGDGGGSVWGGCGGGAGAVSTSSISDTAGAPGGGTTTQDSTRPAGYGGAGGKGAAGGLGTTTSNPATAGAIPAGGGGGGGGHYSGTAVAANLTGAAGARGEVRILTLCS